jgi:hypothetical protein
MQNINRYKKNFFLILMTMPLLFNGSGLFITTEKIPFLITIFQEAFQEQLKAVTAPINQVLGFELLMHVKPGNPIMQADFKEIFAKFREKKDEDSENLIETIHKIITAIFDVASVTMQMGEFFEKLEKCTDHRNLLSLLGIDSEKVNMASIEAMDLETSKKIIFNQMFSTFIPEIIRIIENFEKLYDKKKEKTDGKKKEKVDGQQSEQADGQQNEQADGQQNEKTDMSLSGMLRELNKVIGEGNTMINFMGITNFFMNIKTSKDFLKKILVLLEIPLLRPYVNNHMLETLTMASKSIERAWDEVKQEHPNMSEDQINSEIPKQMVKILIEDLGDKNSDTYKNLEKMGLAKKSQDTKFSKEDLETKVSVGNNGISIFRGSLLVLFGGLSTIAGQRLLKSPEINNLIGSVSSKNSSIAQNNSNRYNSTQSQSQSQSQPTQSQSAQYQPSQYQPN